MAVFHMGCVTFRTHCICRRDMLLLRDELLQNMTPYVKFRWKYEKKITIICLLLVRSCLGLSLSLAVCAKILGSGYTDCHRIRF